MGLFGSSDPTVKQEKLITKEAKNDEKALKSAIKNVSNTEKEESKALKAKQSATESHEKALKAEQKLREELTKLTSKHEAAVSHVKAMEKEMTAKNDAHQRAYDLSHKTKADLETLQKENAGHDAERRRRLGQLHGTVEGSVGAVAGGDGVLRDANGNPAHGPDARGPSPMPGSDVGSGVHSNAGSNVGPGVAPAAVGAGAGAVGAGAIAHEQQQPQQFQQQQQPQQFQQQPQQFQQQPQQVQQQPQQVQQQPQQFQQQPQQFQQQQQPPQLPIRQDTQPQAQAISPASSGGAQQFASPTSTTTSGQVGFPPPPSHPSTGSAPGSNVGSPAVATGPSAAGQQFHPQGQGQGVETLQPQQGQGQQVVDAVRQM